MGQRAGRFDLHADDPPAPFRAVGIKAEWVYQYDATTCRKVRASSCSSSALGRTIPHSASKQYRHQAIRSKVPLGVPQSEMIRFQPLQPGHCSFRATTRYRGRANPRRIAKSRPPAPSTSPSITIVASRPVPCRISVAARPYTAAV